MQGEDDSDINHSWYHLHGPQRDLKRDKVKWKSGKNRDYPKIGTKESWRTEETYCHSDCQKKKKLPVKTAMKTPMEKKLKSILLENNQIKPKKEPRMNDFA